ncbi:MAG: efflux RND transporter periplasmic adaptor subunit [Acidobacteria bacterium]|nr:efflux RND transporter periplasmic adaptor subunit [Acidobacteriota bacterium]
MGFRNRHFFHAVMLAVALALVIFAAGCKRATSGSAAVSEAAELKPVEVATALAEGRDVPLFVQATGSFAADEVSDVASQAAGQIIATPVDVGSFVKQGTVIARLDDRDAKLRLQQLLASARQAEAALRQAEAKLGLGSGKGFEASTIPEVAAARQNFEAADAQARLAETNARRYQNLVATGDVSQIVYDQARTQADTARAQANAAKQQYEVAINVARQNNQGIATAQAALEAARAQVAIARKAVNDTVITAPFAGYISERPVALGEYVTPQSKIATLLKTNPIKLKVQLPEGDAARARRGVTVSATVAAFPNTEFSGQVSDVNPALDPASRTVTVEVNLKNDNNRLKPGMFASAKLYEQGGGRGIFVPKAAVMTEANISTARVYVVEGEVARLRVVQTGETEGDSIRLVHGVKEGEVVVTSNLEQLYDGAKIIKK